MATPIMNTPGVNSKLNALFTEQLQRAYWAEKKMSTFLPEMRSAATTQQLKDAFSIHLDETNSHIEKLKRVFQYTSEELYAKECPVMKGIAQEVRELIDVTDDDSAQRDAALILAAQTAEHYEITTYGTLIQMANTLGFQKAADIMAEILAEEKRTDHLLTQIAESGVNFQAGRETEESANG